MAVDKLTFYRGNRTFIKKFSLTQDGSFYDLSLLSTPVILWWFLSSDKKTKKFITGGTVEGANNDTVPFTVPDKFFDTVVIFDSQIEVYDDTNLLVHSEDIFEVEILEPVGVHTDPTST